MAPLQFNTFQTEEGTDYVTFIGPNGPRVTNDQHHNYAKIVGLLRQSVDPAAEPVDPYHVDELFDIEGTLAKKFERLSERVLVRQGKIFFDGEPINNTLTDQLLRWLDEDGQSVQPLVNFWENLAANPQEDSRERAYDWLASEKFTITEDGEIVGYKSVRKDRNSNPEDPIFHSINGGPAIVDDMEHESGPVPQCCGSVVEIARGQVTHDPHRDCAYGLHVGTYGYARGFAGETVLEVRVNPRDIVSVPNGGDKMRVCRYTVVGPVDEKYEACVLSTPKPEPRVYDEPTYTVTPVEPTPEEEIATAPEPVVTVDPGNPDGAVEESKVKHPSKAEFEKMVGRAKRRRRNFAKYAAKHGPWTYIGAEDGDEKNRLNWSL